MSFGHCRDASVVQMAVCLVWLVPLLTALCASHFGTYSSLVDQGFFAWVRSL